MCPPRIPFIINQKCSNCWVFTGGRDALLSHRAELTVSRASVHLARCFSAYLSLRPRHTTGILSSTLWPPCSPHFILLRGQEGGELSRSGLFLRPVRLLWNGFLVVCMWWTSECLQRRLQSVTWSDSTGQLIRSLLSFANTTDDEANRKQNLSQSDR